MDGEAVLATMLGTGGGLAPWSFTWAFSEEDGVNLQFIATKKKGIC
jgi:hypothetical protein